MLLQPRQTFPSFVSFDLSIDISKMPIVFNTTHRSHNGIRSTCSPSIVAKKNCVRLRFVRSLRQASVPSAFISRSSENLFPSKLNFGKAPLLIIGIFLVLLPELPRIKNISRLRFKCWRLFEK